MFQIVASNQPVRLTDPKAIRALAHPARLAVLEELASGRQLTATECAEIAGLSPSAMSYHLRNLERAGIVERAPSTGDGRERPWRSAGTYVRVETDDLPGGTAINQALSSAFIGRLVAQWDEWVRRRHEASPEWREASEFASSLDWLLPEELAEIATLVHDKLAQYRRTADDRPEGSRRVRVALFGFPVDQRQ